MPATRIMLSKYGNRCTFALHPHASNIEGRHNLTDQPRVYAEFLFDCGENEDVNLSLVPDYDALIIYFLHILQTQGLLGWRSVWKHEPVPPSRTQGE